MKKLFNTTTLLLLAATTIVNAQWSLTGNAGTNASTNFIGTTDNVALKIRTKNAVRMTVTAAGKVGIGTTAPAFKLDIKGGSINTDSVYRIGGKIILSIKGTSNIFAGTFCGGANTTGSSNTALGAGTFYSNTEGYNNTAIGADALFTNTTGDFNTAIGSAALFFNTIGYLNTAMGGYALYGNTEGFGNAALGNSSLNHNTIGDDNTATGSYSLVNNTEGYSNTASGNYALSSNVTGYSNTGIGDNVNTSIGTLAYATAIGAGAVVNSNDKVRLGDAGVTVVEGPVAYSWPSDARFKENIEDDVKGLDFIMKLQPVSYNFNRLKYARHVRQHLTPEREKTLVEQSQNRTVGFIAQDVERIIQQTGFTSFDAVHAPTNETDNYSVGYAEFVVPLVKAVQELNEENKILKNKIEAMSSCLESLCESSELKSSIENSNATDASKLEQNNPNPFKENTTIGYYILSSSDKALLKIFSMNGEELKSFLIAAKGKGQIEIAANTLSPGVYTYVLIVDEKTVDTKQMVITR